MITANPFKLFFLQYAQERDLGLHWEFANFIQKQRTAIRGFKPPHPPLQRAGECSLFVPEKLGSNERLWNRGAVDLRKGPARAFRSPVQGTRNQLFSGSGFA